MDWHVELGGLLCRHEEGQGGNVVERAHPLVLVPRPELLGDRADRHAEDGAIGHLRGQAGAHGAQVDVAVQHLDARAVALCHLLKLFVEPILHLLVDSCGLEGEGREPAQRSGLVLVHGEPAGAVLEREPHRRHHGHRGAVHRGVGVVVCDRGRAHAEEHQPPLVGARVRAVPVAVESVRPLPRVAQRLRARPELGLPLGHVVAGVQLHPRELRLEGPDAVPVLAHDHCVPDVRGRKVLVGQGDKVGAHVLAPVILAHVPHHLLGKAHLAERLRRRARHAVHVARGVHVHVLRVLRQVVRGALAVGKAAQDLGDEHVELELVVLRGRHKRVGVGRADVHRRAPRRQLGTEALGQLVNVAPVHVHGDDALGARGQRKEGEHPGAAAGVEDDRRTALGGDEGRHRGEDGLGVPRVPVGVEQHVGKVALQLVVRHGGIVAAHAVHAGGLHGVEHQAPEVGKPHAVARKKTGGTGCPYSVRGGATPVPLAPTQTVARP
ncbi:MAG: hypothetical protein CL844_03580 [Crocinitomicaceae bacterium]|nr:hypothetical protein [Crocinitomicaceae bacterium]